MAGGSLYWPLEQALHTDINYLLVSYEGHCAEIRAIFGGKPTPSGPSLDARGKPIVLTPSVFDVQFDRPKNQPRVLRRK